MASIVDQLLATQGIVDPQFRGLNTAQAADRRWVRGPGESETVFVCRVYREARTEGFAVVNIAGQIQVNEPAPRDDTILPFRRPPGIPAA